MRTWLRSKFDVSPRTLDGWNTLTDRMQPPGGVLERFCELHPEVRPDRAELVWEGFQQWVRIRGRQEEALCQPSLAVDELWLQLDEDTDAGSQLPEQVRRMSREPVRDHRSRARLSETLTQAHWDEYAARLPILFLVDEAIGIADGRLYRGQCVEDDCKSKVAQGVDAEPGRTCLHEIPWSPSIGFSGAAP